MASRQLARGTPEFEMFGDFYKMYQEFYEVEETDEYWDAFIQRSGELIEKHKATPIIRNLITALCDYQERMLKERRENDGSNS